ncbi:hypothetical protein [Nonomuraea sp. NPDC003754]
MLDFKKAFAAATIAASALAVPVTMSAQHAAAQPTTTVAHTAEATTCAPKFVKKVNKKVIKIDNRGGNIGNGNGGNANGASGNQPGGNGGNNNSGNINVGNN